MRRFSTEGLLTVIAVTVVLALVPMWWMPSVKAQSSYPGIAYTCSADNIGATLTRLTDCQAPGDNYRRYVTDVVVQSTTATSGLWILRHGTGTNCASGTTTSLLPSAATVARLAAPANTIVPTVLHFNTPLIVPSGRDLCVLGVATNTTTIQVVGYVAP